jgi:hypothetical protein
MLHVVELTMWPWTVSLNFFGEYQQDRHGCNRANYRSGEPARIVDSG